MASATSSGLVFLEPVFLTKVWGGSRLRDLYGRDDIPDGVGESITVSGYPDADCRVRGGEFDGATLSELWRDRRDLFGDATGDAFPLQVKFIDATEDLSIQVHPDADGAHVRGDEEKNECWYVMAPSASGRIIIGHRATSREELARLVDEGRWDDLLRRAEMHAGDFYFIPAGTAHAILAGSLIYEVMQSSSTTYRLYDYDRPDRDGMLRDLHIESALAVLKVPDAPSPVSPISADSAGMRETVYVSNEFFTVRKWEVAGHHVAPVSAPYLLVGILEGSGTVNGEPVSRGDHFVVTALVDRLDVEGELTLMVTSAA